MVGTGGDVKRGLSDTSDAVEWGDAERVRPPDLVPSTTSISLRLPVSLRERIKIGANTREMPSRSPITARLAETLASP